MGNVRFSADWRDRIDYLNLYMWNRTIPLSLPMFSGVLRPLRTVANRTLRRIGVPRRSCASTPPGGKVSAPLGSSWVKGFLGGSIVGSGLVYVLGDTSDGTMSAAGKGEEAPVELGVLDGRDSELIRYLCVQLFLDRIIVPPSCIYAERAVR